MNTKIGLLYVNKTTSQQQNIPENRNKYFHKYSLTLHNALAKSFCQKHTCAAWEPWENSNWEPLYLWKLVAMKK